MRALGSAALYGLSALLWLLSWPFALLGEAAVQIARPLASAARACLRKAREWDPRLQERGRTTGYQPPPGAPPRV